MKEIKLKQLTSSRTWLNARSPAQSHGGWTGQWRSPSGQCIAPPEGWTGPAGVCGTAHCKDELWKWDQQNTKTADLLVLYGFSFKHFSRKWRFQIGYRNTNTNSENWLQPGTQLSPKLFDFFFFFLWPGNIKTLVHILTLYCVIRK